MNQGCCRGKDVSASAQQSFWQAAFDGLQEAVWLVDAGTRTIIFANQRAAQLVGLLRAALAGALVERLAATPKTTVSGPRVPEGLAHGIHSMSSVLRDDGQLVPVERKVVPFHTEGQTSCCW